MNLGYPKIPRSEGTDALSTFKKSILGVSFSNSDQIGTIASQ
jgi:hypothetical protein